MLSVFTSTTIHAARAGGRDEDARTPLGSEVGPGRRDGWALAAPHAGRLERGVSPAAPDARASAGRRAAAGNGPDERAPARGEQARLTLFQRGVGFRLPRLERGLRAILRG